MKYELILLDFDGTLADSFGWFGSALHRAAKVFGFKVIQDHEVQILRGLGPREIIRHLEIPWWKMPFVTAFLRRLMRQEIHQIKLFPGASDALKRLHREGHLIVIVTSNSRENVTSLFDPETLQCIDSIECGVSLFGKKARFNKLLRKYQRAPEKVLAIGDEVRDLEASKSLGIHAGAVTWGYATEEALRRKNPEYVFTNLEQLVSEVLERKE